MRIAFAELKQETNSFVPFATTEGFTVVLVIGRIRVNLRAIAHP